MIEITQNDRKRETRKTERDREKETEKAKEGEEEINNSIKGFFGHKKVKRKVRMQMPLSVGGFRSGWECRPFRHSRRAR